MVRRPVESTRPTTIPTLWWCLSIRSSRILRISESDGCVWVGEDWPRETGIMNVITRRSGTSTLRIMAVSLDRSNGRAHVGTCGSDLGSEELRLSLTLENRRCRPENFRVAPDVCGGTRKQTIMGRGE